MTINACETLGYRLASCYHAIAMRRRKPQASLRYDALRYYAGDSDSDRYAVWETWFALALRAVPVVLSTALRYAALRYYAGDSDSDSDRDAVCCATLLCRRQ